MKQISFLLILASCVLAWSETGVVFELNSSKIDSLLKNGSQSMGSVEIIDTPIACIDLNTNGILKIPGVSFPKSAFSIESRFYLREYYKEDPFISEILASFDRNGTEGIDFRVGGGYNYPLRIDDGYDSLNDWIRPDYLTKIQRATLSKCIGEFALGTGTIGYWKEVYTDRGVCTNTWTHMVATWDGQVMKIYLNGREAIDEWRTIGKALPSFVKDTSTLYFGSENTQGLRHFNGKIEFVRIYNKALSSTEIRDQYIKTFKTATCPKEIIIDSPKSGKVITGTTRFKFSVSDSNGCSLKGSVSKYHIDFCTNPEFSQDVHSYECNDTDIAMKDLIKNDSIDKGVCFFRIRADFLISGLMKKLSDSPAEASSALQPAFFPDQPLSMKIPSNHVNQRENSKFNYFVIYDILGRKVKSNFTKNGLQCDIKSGIYLIKSNNKKMVKTYIQ
jgi:hypothetical protein